MVTPAQYETRALTWPEMSLATHVGTMIYLWHLKTKTKGRYGGPPADKEGAMELDIRGSWAEMVTAGALNLFWSGKVGAINSIDVGDLVEVRGIPVSTKRLMLHNDGKDHYPFVLVDTSKAPIFTLRGWLFEIEGKKPEYWSDPTGKNRWAYFVPDLLLRPMNELRAWLNGRDEHTTLAPQNLHWESLGFGE